MMIAAYNPCSFIDYPGKIAAVIFTKGCNMHCPYCHNTGLLQEKGIDLSAVLEDLEKRRDQVEGLVISGGEPTIHQDLPQILKKFKDLSYPVKLDTNGTNPTMLKDIINQQLVDYIAMDIKTVAEDYKSLSGICYQKVAESVKEIRNFSAYEFRTTVYPTIGLSHLEQLCQDFKNDPYYLQQFRVNQKNAPPPYDRQKIFKLSAAYPVKLRGFEY